MTITVSLKSRTRTIRSLEAVFNDLTSLDQLTIQDLKSYIYQTTKLDPQRVRLTTQDKKVLDDDRKSLVDYGLHEGEEVVFKDLGPQILFLIEYLGPLLIHPIFYTSNPISNYLYGGPVSHSRMQQVAFLMVIAHFLKRELETVFVHRFSNSTMPFRNIFKNSFHYWILSGALLAAPIYSPSHSAEKIAHSLIDSVAWIGLCSGLWAYSELSNLAVHIYLRSLRPPGTRIRKLPTGYGFASVSCPNYLFESLAWFSFSLLTLHWSSILFLAVSTAQMTLWAIKKRKTYIREFKDQVPRHWKAIFPFLI